MDPRQDNDSKKGSLANYKLISHEGVMPVSLSMIGECLRENKQQIGGVDFSRIVVVARVQEIDPKANNKVLLHISDNSLTARVVRGFNEHNDDIEINSYYRMVLLVKDDKDERIMLCEKMEKVSTFEEVNMHILRVIRAAIERNNIRAR